ncbi:hypothetical protein BC832DRAFT_42853 [Gaertneriomyces semiglobifer]|nr:hypothetical protein BC832DRAFT_42853 [Gaertneriomyces semiglobifer]
MDSPGSFGPASQAGSIMTIIAIVVPCAFLLLVACFFTNRYYVLQRRQRRDAADLAEESPYPLRWYVIGVRDGTPDSTEVDYLPKYTPPESSTTTVNGDTVTDIDTVESANTIVVVEEQPSTAAAAAANRANVLVLVYIYTLFVHSCRDTNPLVGAVDALRH